MNPAEEEFREGRRMGTGVTGQENLSPSGLVLLLLHLLLLILLCQY